MVMGAWHKNYFTLPRNVQCVLEYICDNLLKASESVQRCYVPITSCVVAVVSYSKFFYVVTEIAWKLMYLAPWNIIDIGTITHYIRPNPIFVTT